MSENPELYTAITNFADKYGRHTFSDEENHEDYMKLVDMCVEAGLIHPANRHEFSTHSRLDAAIIYEDNRHSFCSMKR